MEKQRWRTTRLLGVASTSAPRIRYVARWRPNEFWVTATILIEPWKLDGVEGCRWCFDENRLKVGAVVVLT